MNAWILKNMNAWILKKKGANQVRKHYLGDRVYLILKNITLTWWVTWTNIASRNGRNYFLLENDRNLWNSFAKKHRQKNKQKTRKKQETRKYLWKPLDFNWNPFLKLTNFVIYEVLSRNVNLGISILEILFGKLFFLATL